MRCCLCDGVGGCDYGRFDGAMDGWMDGRGRWVEHSGEDEFR